MKTEQKKLNTLEMIDFLKMVRIFCIQRRPKYRRKISKRNYEFTIHHLVIDLNNYLQRDDIIMTTITIGYYYDPEIKVSATGYSRRHEKDKHNFDFALNVARERAYKSMGEQIGKILLAKEKGII